jgi:hypothetical protein
VVRDEAQRAKPRQNIKVRREFVEKSKEDWTEADGKLIAWWREQM